MAAQEKKDTLHGVQYVAQCVACAALTAGCSAINYQSLFQVEECEVEPRRWRRRKRRSLRQPSRRGRSCEEGSVSTSYTQVYSVTLGRCPLSIFCSRGTP